MEVGFCERGLKQHCQMARAVITCTATKGVSGGWSTQHGCAGHRWFTSWVGQKGTARAFTLPLRMMCNLKLISCLLLESSI